jgi:hypothetical protein
MTLENLYFFLAGIALMAIGSYVGYVLKNLKRIAIAKSKEELHSSVKFTADTRTNMLVPSLTPTSNKSLMGTMGTMGAEWNKPHFPRLEDMF